MRQLLAAVGGAVLAASFLVAPAVSVQAAEDMSYLFVVDSTDIRVIPLNGDAARVVITGAAVTRFTDRPEREAERIGMRGMLRGFGWTRASQRLKDSTPNASISIAGERSQIVDIKRARVGDGRVVLRVKGINGPLESMAGPGSVFVDNAPTFPISQSMVISDRDKDGVAVPATVTLNSTTSATITFALSEMTSPLLDGAYQDWVIDFDIGTTITQINQQCVVVSYDLPCLKPDATFSANIMSSSGGETAISVYFGIQDNRWGGTAFEGSAISYFTL